MHTESIGSLQSLKYDQKDAPYKAKYFEPYMHLYVHMVYCTQQSQQHEPDSWIIYIYIYILILVLEQDAKWLYNIL